MRQTTSRLRQYFAAHPQSYEMLMYVITGGLTTLVSLASFYLFATTLSLDYRLANFVSWVLSVIFAYITNRRYVFQSQQQEPKKILREFISFITLRAVSFIADLILLILFVELFKWHAFFAKILTNVVVLILNYLFSKFLVFQNKYKNQNH